jgi:hypothetical protein
MENCDPKLGIGVVWFDDDLVELSLEVRSPDFSGRTTFYAAHDEAATFASHIDGFPSSPDDTREYQFGQAELTGYGRATVRLSCLDNRGHLLVHVTVFHRFGAIEESATVGLTSVPAAVDSFVAQLRMMELRIGEGAVLGGHWTSASRQPIW